MSVPNIDSDMEKVIVLTAETTLNVALCVADFVDGRVGTREEAAAGFEDAASATDKALEAAAGEVAHFLGDRAASVFTLTDPEFHEFDSSNWTHAGAYFTVPARGPVGLVRRLQRAIKEESE